jgi:hypothetical protein
LLLRSLNGGQAERRRYAALPFGADRVIVAFARKGNGDANNCITSFGKTQQPTQPDDGQPVALGAELHCSVCEDRDAERRLPNGRRETTLPLPAFAAKIVVGNCKRVIFHNG